MSHYRIIRRIAAGGMAEVFLGKLVGAGGFEKPVAIKRMLPSLAEDAASAEAFLREARLCVHLVHPNVVQVLDLGTSAGAPWLVMELVDGTDLRKLLTAVQNQDSPLPAAEAIHIAACVAEALAYAWDAPGPKGEPLHVVHRDVNPSNVMISATGEVKLADFGVARAADGRDVTDGNLLKGKLGYLAPELLAGTVAGHASDIFLTGVLLWEMLAGRPLFATGGAPGKTLAQIVAHDENTLPLPEGAPDELSPVLRRALAKDPSARHGHARELAAELREVLHQRRWRVGREELAARLASLFPDRPRLDADISGGEPLVDDRRAPAAAEDLTPVPERRPRRVGELLVDAGLITEMQLGTLLERQRREGGKLGEWAVSMDFAPARSVLQVLSRQLGVPFVTEEKLLEARPVSELLSRLPYDVAQRLFALPISERDGQIYVAMADPGDLEALDLLRFRFGSRVRPIVCTRKGIRRAIARMYGRPDLDDEELVAHHGTRVVGFDRAPTPQMQATAWPATMPTTPPPLPAGVTPNWPGTPPGTPPPGYLLAYVPAGVGPDGQPVYVAMPVPQGMPPAVPVTPPPVAPAPKQNLRAAGFGEREIELEDDPRAEALELAVPIRR